MTEGGGGGAAAAARALGHLCATSGCRAVAGSEPPGRLGASKTGRGLEGARPSCWDDGRQRGGGVTSGVRGKGGGGPWQGRNHK